MAKRRVTRRRASARRPVASKTRTRYITKRAKSRARRVGTAFKPLSHMLTGAGYGFLRAKSSGFVRANISSRIPLGNYADELAFSGLSYLLAKKGGKVMGVNLKDIGRAGLQAEGFLIGHSVGTSGFSLGGGSTSGGGGYPV